MSRCGSASRSLAGYVRRNGVGVSLCVRSAFALRRGLPVVKRVVRLHGAIRGHLVRWKERLRSGMWCGAARLEK